METTARPGVGSTPILAHRSILMVGCRALGSIPYTIHFYIMLEIEEWPLFSEQRASCHPKEPKGISVRTVTYTSSLSLVFEKGRHTQGNICTTKQKESLPLAHQLTSPEANMAREDFSRLIPRYSVLIALPNSCGNI